MFNHQRQIYHLYRHIVTHILEVCAFERQPDEPWERLQSGDLKTMLNLKREMDNVNTMEAK